MGPRNLLILFFSTLAISLVILVILFSLFFKNVDMSFETKMPDAAPDLEELYGDLPDADKADRANIKVPEEYSTRNVSSKQEDEELSKPVSSQDEPKPSAEPETQDEPANPEPQAPNKPPTPPEPKPEPKKEEKKPEELKPADTSSNYQVYVGGFSSREAAQAKADALGQGLVKGSGNSFIVQIGVFSSKDNADSLAGQVGGSVRKLD